MDTSKDYYATLGVLPSIEPTALAAVYRALVKKYHPDVYKGKEQDGERITQELNEAYEVLGDQVKRAAYDTARQSQRPSSGDYEHQKDWDRSTDAGPDEAQIKRDCDYVVRYHPIAEDQRKSLEMLSPALAFSFQITVIATRSADKVAEIGDALRLQFLNRYFGTNTVVYSFVLEALKAGRRDVALEVNQAIKILGTPDESKTTDFLLTVRTTTGWTGGSWRPEPASFPSHTPSRFAVITVLAILSLVCLYLWAGGR